MLVPQRRRTARLKTDSPDEGGSITQASPEFDEDQGDTAMRVSQIRAAHQELMAEYTAVLRYRAHTNLVYPFADLLTSKQTVESHIARTLRDLHVAYIYASQAFQTNESARQWFDTTIQSLGRIQSTLPKEPDWQRTTRYGRILWGAIIALSGLAVALAGDQIWGAISNSHSIKSLSQDFTGDEAFALTMQTIALVLGLGRGRRANWSSSGTVLAMEFRQSHSTEVCLGTDGKECICFAGRFVRCLRSSEAR